jgi:hypothetical protein
MFVFDYTTVSSFRVLTIHHPTVYIIQHYTLGTGNFVKCVRTEIFLINSEAVPVLE